MKKSVIVKLIVLIAIVTIIIGVLIFFSNTRKNLDALNDIRIENIDLSAVPDGTYEGSYDRFPVSVTVEVTVRDGKIGDIILVRHVNGQGQTAEAIVDEVIKQQTLQVDAVSGATYSSKVILLAIDDALKSADK
ncbi:MAG: FMN-binding protein [Oscillospiraceae bacterium]|nr:FMN-binding protein [Oscillospiraceae bacterium]